MLREQRIKVLSVFMEKKTQEEYAREKFKKKHNFIPDKTKGGNDPNHGTFDRGDGTRRRVDMGKSKSVKASSIDDPEKNIDVPRTAMVELGKPKNREPNYYLDRSFFKLKNGKRREAILQHEVGHDKFHNTNYTDSSESKASTKSTVDSFVKNANIKTAYKSIGVTLSDKELKKVENEARMLLTKIFQENRATSPKELPDKSKQKLRREMLKILKNKCGKSPHDNPMEKEADLHAVNKTSRKDLMKGVNEYSKKISKERQKQTNKALDEYGVTGKDKEKQLKKAKTSLNKELSEDSRNRSKVLKDKKLLEKSKKVYN